MNIGFWVWLNKSESGIKSHSSHPFPLDGSWGAYPGAEAIWSGRLGWAVPEQLLITGGILTPRSNNVVGVPKTREKKTDEMTREDRSLILSKGAEGWWNHHFSDLAFNMIAG